ncbi:hypothetical protein [Lacticaseibacillus brantae]|uniref:Integral membrane protein n=1 Tax=Lacticaseibacillus brantae DSM 23927 TaxID=1423727 RepID=A0A0R2BAF7_9LACO|nr:hypothetical protein [Lacticaseibacillus brantae]KRM72716.1 hypothetical protein FC34_GL000426 [Lacticaseibacillus brantae DSM 23927]
MRKYLTHPLAVIPAISVVIVFVIPFLFRLLHISAVWRISLCFILINMVAAWFFGRWQKHRGLPFWISFCLPILFALNVWLQYAPYNYWFAGIYLVLTWLAVLKD